ncbi:MAG: zf-HC2 domain-containing protein [Lachnospiraceae bacterium]|nr:zf-HC2 domain-containing protein [Lachnospiraceae bacterium]
MRYECDVIEDLLPLYEDGACSTATIKAVEEHLSECDKCRTLLEKLKDTSIDSLILQEKENVIGAQSKYFKRKSAVAGSIIGGIFTLPILICLIVDLVSGHGLGWFFIVFAAMLIPTSLLVVPLLAPKNRMLQAMVSLTASILILLAVCCIYSKGNWFFLAASAVLFGLTVCFSPFIACRRPVNAYLKNYKGLTVMAADTVTFFLMMIIIGFYTTEKGYFGLMFSISIPLVMMAWGVFLLIRYLPTNGLAKAGACIAAICGFSYFGTKVILWMTLRLMDENAVQVYTGPTLGYALIGVGFGVLLAVIGLLFGKKRGKRS